MSNLNTASGYADLGMWFEAWEALEDLPAEQRSSPEALVLRLRLCTELGIWPIGREIAKLYSKTSLKLERETAGRFYLTWAVHLARKGDLPAARDALQQMARVWQEGRLEALHAEDLDGVW